MRTHPWLMTGMLAVCLAALIVGTRAGADVQVGGEVPSYLALSIGTPTDFARVGDGTTYELRVPVQVTSTVDSASISVADGEDFVAPGRGHLHDGGDLVAAPLQVGVNNGPLDSLAAPLAPVLQTWSEPLSLFPVTVVVRQRLTDRASITAPQFHKILLITVSTATP